MRLKFLFLWLLVIAAPAFGQSFSTNKTFMLNLNNVLPPNETNFFAVNSNLLNLAVLQNGGGNSNFFNPGAGIGNAVTSGGTGSTNTISVLGNLLSLFNLANSAGCLSNNGAGALSWVPVSGGGGGQGVVSGGTITNVSIVQPTNNTLSASNITFLSSLTNAQKTFGVNTNGAVTATSFSGNGAGVTGIVLANIAQIAANTVICNPNGSLGAPSASGSPVLASLSTLANGSLSSSNITATNFIGSGSLLTALNGTQITSGTVPAAALPVNLQFLNTNNGVNLTNVQGPGIVGPITAQIYGYANLTNILVNGQGNYATNTYSMTTTGYTNIGTNDIQVFEMTGTSVVYSNSISTSHFSLGTTTSPGVTFILKPLCSVTGTGMAAAGMEASP